MKGANIMIGNMISKIRKEKGITKTQLASETDINIGHLTHIEKGERNPSHKALKSICSALNIPYQQLLYTYDKTLSEDQIEYGYINHVNYNRIPAISKIDEYINCPADFSDASFAYKVHDLSFTCIKQTFFLFIRKTRVTRLLQLVQDTVNLFTLLFLLGIIIIISRSATFLSFHFRLLDRNLESAQNPVKYSIYPLGYIMSFPKASSKPPSS